MIPVATPRRLSDSTGMDPRTRQVRQKHQYEDALEREEPIDAMVSAGFDRDLPRNEDVYKSEDCKKDGELLGGHISPVSGCLWLTNGSMNQSPDEPIP